MLGNVNFVIMPLNLDTMLQLLHLHGACIVLCKFFLLELPMFQLEQNIMSLLEAFEGKSIDFLSSAPLKEPFYGYIFESQ